MYLYFIHVISLGIRNLTFGFENLGLDIQK